MLRASFDVSEEPAATIFRVDVQADERSILVSDCTVSHPMRTSRLDWFREYLLLQCLLMT